MSLQNTNITSKNYKKLSIQVSLTGLSFCCFDTLNNTITSLKEIHFETFHKATKIEELFGDAFKNNPELKDNYDEILVIHNNNLSTFVPTACLTKIILEVICSTIQRFLKLISLLSIRFLIIK